MNKEMLKAEINQDIKKQISEIKKEISQLEISIIDKTNQLELLKNKQAGKDIGSCKAFSNEWNIVISRWNGNFTVVLKLVKGDYKDYKDLTDLIGYDTQYQLNKHCYIYQHDDEISIFFENNTSIEEVVATIKDFKIKISSKYQRKDVEDKKEYLAKAINILLEVENIIKLTQENQNEVS